LSIDGAALLLAFAAATGDLGDDSDDFAYAAAGVYVLGSPIAHFAHHNPGRGLGSLALRTGLPFALGGLGLATADCAPEEEACGVGEAAIGTIVGMVAAIVIDAGALGYEKVAAPSAGLSNIGVSLGRDHSALVAAGTFW